MTKDKTTALDTVSKRVFPEYERISFQRWERAFAGYQGDDWGDHTLSAKETEKAVGELIAWHKSELSFYKLFSALINKHGVERMATACVLGEDLHEKQRDWEWLKNHRGDDVPGIHYAELIERGRKAVKKDATDAEARMSSDEKKIWNILQGYFH